MLPQMKKDYPWLLPMARNAAFKNNEDVEEMVGVGGLAIAKGLWQYDPQTSTVPLDVYLRICVKRDLIKAGMTRNRTGLTRMKYKWPEQSDIDLTEIATDRYNPAELDWFLLKAAQNKLNSLKPKMKRRLLMFIEGYSLQEIADIVGVHLSSVHDTIKKHFPYQREVWDHPRSRKRKAA